MSEDSTAPTQSRAKNIIRSGCWSIFLILVLLILGAVLFPTFEMPLRFVFGWIFYVRQVLPHIDVNTELVLTSLAALVLGFFSLRWVIQRIVPGLQWRWRWSLAWCGLIIIGFATSIAAVGIVHQTGWLFRLSNWHTMSGMILSARSIGDGRWLAASVTAHAGANGGRLPETLRDLSSSELESPELLLEAKTNEEMEPWIYVGAGLTTKDNGKLPIFWSARPDRNGRYVLGRLDGSVSGIKASQLSAEIQTLREHWAKADGKVQ